MAPSERVIFLRIISLATEYIASVISCQASVSPNRAFLKSRLLLANEDPNAFDSEQEDNLALHYLLRRVPKPSIFSILTKKAKFGGYLTLHI